MVRTAVMGARGRIGRTRVIVLVAALVLFAGTVLAKGGARSGGLAGGHSGASVTSVHNDAVADYGAALKTGKPIYVLFHSLTCDPCLRISAVADEVVPAYRDRVVFVNAITDDPSAQQLASRFSFQYIPTSFFIAPGGKVLDSHTGVLTAEEMRGRLDKLVGR
jgi:thiol-disulfide isomerase/thioredoxin